MIDPLPGFPDNVLAFACRGRVTRADYETVLVPAVERALARQGRVRLYYAIGGDFAGFDAGAVWEDFKVGMEHLTRWERVAVVTDVAWIRHAVQLFSFLMPAKVKVFPAAEADQARTWIIAEG